MQKIKYFNWPFHFDALFKGSVLILIFMIFAMVLIGGLTRLTGSGLSIVEWKPITGIFPPLTIYDWEYLFKQYQQSPEFQKINLGISLNEFQSIFWLEYIHRLWGRLIGIVLFIPTFLMVFKNQHRNLGFLLGLLWILGFAQAFMGWFMVKSGLLHDPYVSPYRLVAHLLLGFAIFGVVLWIAFHLYGSNPYLKQNEISQKTLQLLKKLTYSAIFFMLLTAILGAFVAGLKAGLLYNTFPLMGENFIPYEFLTYSPWWKDLLENPVSVQFLHRFFAISTVVFCWGIWIYQRKLLIPPFLSQAFLGIALIVFLQLSLGISTLLLEVPLFLAILHQGFAFILFGSLLYTIFLLHKLGYQGKI